MGKNLKGKECGTGICQRKDGLYSSRCYTKAGGRKEKYFKTLPEAKNWLADTQYELRHHIVTTNSDMSVDNWFDYWITNLICNLAPNTLRNYRERYMRNVQPVIGSMCMGDVKPMHCKIILNQMESSYAGSTILQTYIAMGTMFKAAVMNDVILKHPMDGVRFTSPQRIRTAESGLRVYRPPYRQTRLFLYAGSGIYQLPHRRAYQKQFLRHTSVQAVR